PHRPWICGRCFETSWRYRHPSRSFPDSLPHSRAECHLGQPYTYSLFLVNYSCSRRIRSARIQADLLIESSKSSTNIWLIRSLMVSSTGAFSASTLQDIAPFIGRVFLARSNLPNGMLRSALKPFGICLSDSEPVTKIAGDVLSDGFLVVAIRFNLLSIVLLADSIISLGRLDLYLGSNVSFTVKLA